MIKLACMCGYTVEEPAINQAHYWFDMMALHMAQEHNINGKFDDLLVVVEDE